MANLNTIKVILALGAAGGGYHYWTNQQANIVREASGPAISDSGFVAVPPLDDQSAGAVMIVAAENCPHEDAQRADALAQALADKGIPVVRTHQLKATLEDTEGGEAQNLMTVMNGPLPAVFVNGRAKSNPSLAEVVAEFNRR